MKVPLSWLRDYVDMTLPVPQLVERLTLAGLEVSGVRVLGLPVAVGPSRKGTIGHILGGLPVQERVEGTAAAVAVCVMNGADVIRVHDVGAMVRVARAMDAIIRVSE